MTKSKIIKSISISVICCCYNSEKYILETLLSIKNQTYKKYEIIIINDGSIDKTKEIINKFIEKNLYLKIKLINQKNNGLASARNLAVKHASYDWISIIDHDDIWVKNKLEEQVREIKENQDCSLFFSDFEFYNNSKIKKTKFTIASTKDNFYPHKLNLNKNKGFINLAIRGCFIGSSTVIFKKKILKKTNGFDLKYIFLTDYIFFLRVAENYNMYCSAKILSKWREHNDQSSYKINNIYVKEMNRLYFKLYFNNILKLQQKFIIMRNQIRLNLITILKYFKIL